MVVVSGWQSGRVRPWSTATERDLRHELKVHFDLDPVGMRPDTMAARVITWWASVETTAGTAKP